MRRPALWLALLVVAALLLPLGLGAGYEMQVLDIALLNAIAVVGLNFVSGWTGQINFGQAAFYGLGAYATAIATKAGLPWLGAPLLSACVAALAALVLGLPTLRLRSYYLAMTTIGFGEIVRLVFVHWEEVTGGSSGLRAIPPVQVGSLRLEGPLQYYYLILALLALAILVARRIESSHLGRAMVATRDSEIAAELSAVDTVRTKVAAFVLGAVYAGVAGSIYASSIHYISPESFNNQQAVLLLTMLIVGGSGSIAGAVIGAVGLTILPELLRFLGQWYLVLYGIGVVGVIILAPGGLIALMRWIGRRAAAAPS
jgi:branched-chain amino acid transport system permease protein